MDITSSDARELMALRAILADALALDEIRTVNWAAVATAARPAIARGWTGSELAKWSVGELGADTANPGAVIVTTLRQLASADPPRERTPEPPPIGQVLAEMHSRNTAAANPSEWAARVRASAR